MPKSCWKHSNFENRQICYVNLAPDPEITQNIPYLFKNLSKSRLSDPFFGLFLVISEVESQIYIANLAIFKIWVFSATFWHEITLYAIYIDKKRFRTPFLALNFPQHLRMSHKIFWGEGEFKRKNLVYILKSLSQEPQEKSKTQTDTLRKVKMMFENNSEFKLTQTKRNWCAQCPWRLYRLLLN